MQRLCSWFESMKIPRRSGQACCDQSRGATQQWCSGFNSMEMKAVVVNFGVREKWKPQFGLRGEERAMGEINKGKKLFQ